MSELVGATDRTVKSVVASAIRKLWGVDLTADDAYDEVCNAARGQGTVAETQLAGLHAFAKIAASRGDLPFLGAS